MSLTVSQIKSAITPKLRGTTLAKVGDIYLPMKEASSNLLSRCYPLETIRKSRIDNAIYSHVYNYIIDQDVRGNKGIIDIRPISERSTTDDLEGRFSREFDIKKDEDTFTIEVLNGIKTLRLSKAISSQLSLAQLNSLTNSFETITAIGDVENLEINAYDFITGYGSLQFGLSGVTGAGAVAIALAQSVNLETIEDIGALFNWLSFASASRLNSVTLKWGSDNANYWSKAVTTPHDRTAFESNAWTLQRFDWASASVTGSPDATAIDYIEIAFNYDIGAALTNNRLDSVTTSVGRPYEAVYYSNRFFKTTAGSYIEIPTSDDDVINIATEGHNIFIYELMLVLIQQLGQKSVNQSSEWFQKQLNGYGQVEGLYSQYNKNYPCQAIPKQVTYYEFPDR